MRSRLCAAALVSCVVSALVVVPMSVSSSAAAPDGQLPATVPSVGTPEVRDGTVLEMEEVGATVVVAGSFRTVAERGGSAVQQRGVFAFDPATGALVSGFRPVLDDQVDALLPGPDPGTVYIAGTFRTVNGVARKGVALLDLATGAPVASFRPVYLNGVVRDLALVQGRLVLGGTFTTVNSQPRAGLATVDPRTAVLDAYLTVGLSVNHNWNGSGAKAAVGVENLAVSPEGTRMVVIGNFRQADGLSRDQVVLLDLGPTAATVDQGWATTRFDTRCGWRSYDSFVRDVDYAPDGSYFVVVTTGGPQGGSLCDTATRWDLAVRGLTVQPTWISSTGGDTLLSVEVTDDVVYTGGHQRWMNNPLGSDRAQGGAVPRPGLAAVAPDNGVPFSWNPGRNPRGAGAEELLATSSGLWVGSDTEYIGDFEHRRPRLALLPFAGGSALPQQTSFSLPGNVFQAAPAGSSQTSLVRRWYGEPGVTDTATLPTGVDWSTVRGAFVIDSTLYHGSSDGKLYRRAFDGSSVGPAELVDPYNDPAWSTVDTGSGQTYRGALPNLYGSELAGASSLLYQSGRLYYTLAGQSGLFWRSFNAESAIVGSTRTQVAGVSMPTDLRAAFLTGDDLHFTRTDGRLQRVAWNGGAPALATTVAVGGPAIDGVDWSAQELFVGPGPTPAPNVPPTAAFVASCGALTCQLNGTSSTDPDGSIGQYAWQFGDGSTGTGPVVEHAFAAAGTYDVVLTVTDAQLATASTTRSVTVAFGNVAPLADAVVSCTYLECSLDGRGSSDSDGSLVSWNWDTDDGATESGALVSHTFAAAGTYDVVLTVTDDTGTTSSATRQVVVQRPPGTVAHVGTATAAQTTANASVRVPASVAPGDGLVLVVSVNKDASVGVTTPAGWSLVQERSVSGMRSVVLQRVAQAADAGALVPVALSETSKVDLQLSAYRGTAASGPVGQVASRADTTTTATHTTPSVVVEADRSWVLSYWADKSSTVSSWSAPAGQVVRAQSLGSGTGYITSLWTDGGGPVAAGTTVGGLTATTNVAGSKAISWTLVLRPA